MKLLIHSLVRPLLAATAVALGGLPALAQVTLPSPQATALTVTPGTGVLRTPANFWTANASAIGTAVSGTVTPPWSAITSKPTTLSGFGITDAQALDSDLSSIAALSTTSFGRSVLALSDGITARAYFGLAIGTDVQGYDSDLAAYATAANATARRQLDGSLGYESPKMAMPVRVMANPPLVTGSAGGASSGIAGSVLYGPASSQFAYNATNIAPLVYATGYWSRTDYMPLSAEFTTAAEDFEVLAYGEQRGAWRFWINGELVSERAWQPRVPGSKNADGLGYLFRLRFSERSDFTEPAWLAEYLRPTQDARIQWVATDPTPGAYLVNESTWAGASGTLSTAPPTGWSLLGTAQCQLVASDSSETNVLRVVAAAASDAIRITSVVPSPTTVALKLRVRTVGSASWTLRLQGGAINNFVTIAGADFPSWHTIYVPIGTSSSGADGLGFVASGAGELWIDQVQLFEWTSGMASDWAPSTRYYRGDLVEPTTATGYIYRADVVRPEIKRVRIDMGKYASFGGVRLGASDALLPGAPIRRPVVLVVGDSFTNGGDAIGGDNSFGVAGWDSWCHVMADQLGWDCYPDGQSGTGYIAVGASAKFRDRLPALYAINPDIVVFAGGFNDRTLASWTTGDVVSEFEQCVAAVRTNLPAARVLAVGPWTYRVSATEPTNGLLDTNAALRDRAATLGVPYVDVVESGWLSGDWTVAGSGNANQLFDNNGVHPNRLGHRMLGLGIGREIAKLANGVPARPLELTLYSSGAWAGATGGTQPTGWNKFNTPVFTVGTFDGQADALEVVADAANEGMDRSMLPTGAWGYSWSKVTLRFKIKVGSGEVVCNSTGSAIPSSGGHRYISARVRPVGGTWTTLSGITLGRSSSLNWTPFLNTTNAGSWIEVEIVANAAQSSVQFYSRNAAATWYLKDLSMALHRD